ncbi:phospholipase D-like domain-containing protein [Castellaniella sp. S9]|uniref:phospholipase D-like domain-containing protein n=1 Tax=Castellaniella sp. S9 TaxID=2993652 RepID=UPI0022B2C5F7|nr:phospholipase D-like domain-containing protein [Castellaniella sp. S9]
MDALTAFLAEYWPHVTALASLGIGAAAAIHAAMNKSDVRAAIAWVGVILMSPLVGPVLYLVAGINRIRHDQLSIQRSRSIKDYVNHARRPFTDVASRAGPQFASLRVLCDRISRFPLHDGNRITLLDSGDEAYPAMIDAIDGAQHCIALQTYIFDHDRIGLRFAEALRAAHQRGVRIRVLIDAIGSKYSHPPIIRLLLRNGIRAELFMTNPLGLRMPYANLRSHRKILFVDGHLGFTGGMNIREGFMASLAGSHATHDTHFRIEGPVATQLFAVFANDWEFTTRERLPIEEWCVTSPDVPAPHVPARCVRSSPDRFIAASHNVLLGALAVAQRHVRIQSPYFLPDQILMGALNTAARRGIQVDIVIPGRNNLRLVNYAMTAQLDQVLAGGCRIWRSRSTFNHSKLLTIDGGWSYVGSSNLDPRSLRLNFELDMEVYDPQLAGQIEARIDREIADAEAVTRESLAAIPFIKRLRNRVIWLASPYL